MDKEPNKNNEPNEEAKVLSDEELEGIVGGGCDLCVGETVHAIIKSAPGAIAGAGIVQTVAKEAVEGTNS